ncbi:MAG: hypothetical protein ACO1RX_14765 [Candidatus Sericytochromatia bacterium]
MNSATASFDPTAFQLPDSLRQVRGPEVQAPPVTLEIRFVEQQLALERAQPQPQAPVVEQNLQRQVKQVREQARTEQLKEVLLSLKNLRPRDPAELPYRSVLLQAIEALKTCFAGEAAPTDLETMGLLFPLLKCQEHKWERLQAGQLAEPPAPEAKLLQKWRSAKSSLSAVEKATFYQIVEGLNVLIARMPAPAEAPISEAETPAPVTPVPAPESPAEEPFDPMTCGRRLMQLRAKLQRSCAESEKQRLQAQLNALVQQQNAYYAERRSQSLVQHQKKYAQLCQKLSGPVAAAALQQLRQELIQQLEHLQRLFHQDKQQPAGPEIFASASRQLARLGLADAAQVRSLEHTRQGEWIQAFPASQQNELTRWQTSYQTLLTAFEQALGQALQQAQTAELTARIQAAQTHLQTQRQVLAELEQAWQAAADSAEQAALRQNILLAYAQLILKLPPSSA